jgi:hypothetical protein
MAYNIDKNLAQSSLVSPYTAGDTTITLQTGDGAKFDSPNFVLAMGVPPEFFLKVTGKSGDVLTVDTSGFDGSTAVGLAAATPVTEVITSGVLKALLLQALAVTTKGDLQGFSTVPDRVPVGSDGQVLTADSTASLGVSYKANPAGGLVLLEQHTASSSSELDFTTAISAAYDEYLIEIVNLINGSAAFVGFQMSTNGGSTYDTGNNYDYNGNFSFNASNGHYGSNSTSAVFFRDSTTTLASNGSWNGSFKLFAPLGSLYKMMTGQLSWYDASLGIVSSQIVGIWKNTAAMNAFRLLPDTGNFTSGTVRVYGLAK